MLSYLTSFDQTRHYGFDLRTLKKKMDNQTSDIGNTTSEPPSGSIAPKLTAQNLNSSDCLSGGCLSMVIISSCLCICGIIANFLVFMLILLDKKIHTPTFVAIGSLSIADFIYIFFRYISYNLSIFGRSVMSEDVYYIFVRIILNTIILAAIHSSIFHIISLAIMRYIVVVHPFKSRIWINNRRICVSSALIWCLSIAMVAFYIYAVIINREKNASFAKYVNIVYTVVLTFLPIILLSFLHILKTKRLKKSVAASKSNTVQNMSKMVTFVIIVYLISNTPINARDILELSFGFDQEFWFLILTLISHILYLFNFVLNPFIYFVHSPIFRKSIKRVITRKISSKYSFSGTF